jgi:predicted heme/steroid binding protein
MQNWVVLFVLYTVAIIISSTNTVTANDEKATPTVATKEESCTSTTENDGECLNPDAGTDDGPTNSKESKPPRPVVTKEELSKHNGKDGADIWLSVLGEVYDVSEGKQYYAPGMSYGAFAGTDCSVCYVTGKFTPEEAEKPLDEITDKLIGGILDWKDFYEKHETYKYVGRLIDPRYFDETGSPTPSMQEFARRVVVYQIEAAEKKKKRDADRQKREAERAARKRQQEMAKATASKAKQKPKVESIL